MSEIRIKRVGRTGWLREQTFEAEVRSEDDGPWSCLGVMKVSKLTREMYKVPLHTTDMSDLIRWANEDYEAGVSRWLYPVYGSRPEGPDDATPSTVPMNP